MAKKRRKSKIAGISVDPQHFLEIAGNHLQRVRIAATEHDPDWSDIGTYGLYCLEALVRAAALKDGETPIRTHWGKADQADNLSKKHNLPEIHDLLSDLNTIRKAEAYGDVDFDESDYDAEEIAARISEYFDKVRDFCE